MPTKALDAIRRGALLVLGLAALSPAARGAEVIFRPVLSFGVFHSGNVLLIGYDPATGQQATPVGDEFAALAVDLDYDRKTIDSSLSFHYRPSYVWYRQRSDLDYLGNVIAFGYAKQRSRQGGFSASLEAERTDFQGVTALNADHPNTIVPRTTITRAHVSVRGSEVVSLGNLIDWEVHGEAERYEPIPNVVFNNSHSVGVRAGWRFEFSERGTIGLAVNGNRFEYETSPSVNDESLVLTGTYSLGRNTDMVYDVGVSRATSEGVSRINGVFVLSFTQKLTGVSSLNTGASQSHTSGTGLQGSGSTRDTGAWVSYRREPQRRGLNGAIDSSYWYRSVLDLGSASTGQTSTFVLDGSLGWTVNRYVSLNVAAAYTNQNAKNGAPGALDADYATYGINVRWVMRGR